METPQNNSNSWKPTSPITSSTHDNEQHQTSLTPTYEMQDLGPAPSSSSNLPTSATQSHVHSKRERCVCLKFIGVLLLLVLVFTAFIAAFLAALIGTMYMALYGYYMLIRWTAS